MDGSKVSEPVIEILIEAAGSRRAWWLEYGRNDRREGAPTVGALGDIGRVGGNQSEFGCHQCRTVSRISLLFLVE